MFCQFTFAQSPPNAENDTYEVATNATLNIGVPGVLGNDTDADGDTLVVTQYLINSITYSAGNPANLTEGTITINANGGFTFTPAANYNGNIPVINYSISDGTSTDTANLAISIINTAPPVANDDYDTVEVNTTLNVPASGVLVNDNDPDNNSLLIVDFTVNGTVYTVGQIASLAEGDFTMNSDGSFSFVPTPNYTGNVPTINYTVSDGTFTSTANLLLTVEPITDLLNISSLTSCNQGFDLEGNYNIRYNISIANISTARDYHANNLIRNIDLTHDLQAIYGNGCVQEIDNVTITTTSVTDYVNNPYPTEFDANSVNQDFLDGTSNSLFNNNAITNFVLYPRQSIQIQFCVTINPFCNGRSNPTPSGSGIDFDGVFNITSNLGNTTNNIELTDFHTTEAIITAGLYIPERNPVVDSNGIYNFENTVVITNQGTATANNINYNMGLASFLDNGIIFNQINVRQVSGPSVTVNPAYNGDTSTQLLNPNNSLGANETVILEIAYSVAPISASSNYSFNQFDNSQTQGALDGFDESTPVNMRFYSFVTWSDSLGNHLDRYYPVTSATEVVSSTQCSCQTSSMGFSFTSSSSSSKIISNVNEAPNGILEHQEITFQLNITNTSNVVELINLQLEENLTTICSGNILSVTTPIITNTTATTTPVLNTSFNGTTNVNLFNGTSGLLKKDESVTVELTVVFDEDCIGTNTVNFSGVDPLGNTASSSGNIAVRAFTDTDNDGVSNETDLDDDNDTILDVDEYNGLNPLDDDDSDFIPNYRDTDYGADANNDGIVDVFDFDNDGVPNHFDLDSDNDGVLDILEVGNNTFDTDNNGRTNNTVGANGLDNTIENNDTVIASITYTIPNTDANGNFDFLDIDADGDGIVDNIEAQSTTNYTTINNTVSSAGINTAYPNGITPIDTDGDTIFDYLDLNSDNDIRNDVIEGWDLDNDGVAETIAINIDSDSDGLDNAYDVNDGTINPTNNQTPSSFPNVDNPDDPERDWREVNAIEVIVNNVSTTEGGNLVYTISLVTKIDNSVLIQSATPIVFELSTSNGTITTTTYDVATAPFDYNEIVTTSVTIPPFTDQTQFSVTSLDDNIYETNELFTLNGTVTSNNTVNTNFSGIGTIIDNDAAPSITMNNSQENEGVDLVHTILISHPSSTPVIVDVNTSDNSAVSPDDYTAVSTRLTIDGTVNPVNPNLNESFSITTLLDNTNELNNEQLNIVGTVLSPNIGVRDLTKTGIIVDIDPDPIVAVEGITVTEGMPLEFTITLLNASSEPMKNYLPINLNLEAINETATVNLDFQRLQIISSVPAYTNSIIQPINTIDDKLNEETETILLQTTILSTGVSNPSSTILTQGIIKDNDYPNLFSPNGDGKSDFFKISGIEDFPNFKLNIVDRWGGEVFNYNNNGSLNPDWWDGTYNGKKIIEGVYFYTLDFNDGVTSPKTGFIQLIR